MANAKCASCGDVTKDGLSFLDKPRCIECYAELTKGEIVRPEVLIRPVADRRKPVEDPDELES